MQFAEGFVQGTAELVVMLAAALATLASIVGSVYLLISKTSSYRDWKKKRRLMTCPIKEMSMESLGGLILFFCTTARRNKVLPMHERTWLIKAFTLYDAANENGTKATVRDSYDHAMLLPSELDEEE